MSAPHPVSLDSASEHVFRTILCAAFATPSTAPLQQEFCELLPPAVERRGGQTLQVSGERLLAGFPTCQAASWCALEIQFGLHLRNSTAADVLAVRIGLNSGPVEGEDVAPHVGEVAAKLEAAGAAGEILLSPSAFAELHDVEDFAILKTPKIVALKGGAIEVYEIVWRACDPKATRPPQPNERQVLLAAGSAKAGLFHRLLKWGK